ncbi:MAG: hypothetical protein HY811_10295 [Planctomycetes bacterium]|nr:hypothetical protein [Planctomycetota bacterium]
MKEFDIIEKLAESAREEQTPSLDVTQSVIQSILAKEEPVVSSWLLITSSLATVSSFILFWQICLVPQDPLTAFFESIRNVLL